MNENYKDMEKQRGTQWLGVCWGERKSENEWKEALRHCLCCVCIKISHAWC